MIVWFNARPPWPEARGQPQGALRQRLAARWCWFRTATGIGVRRGGDGVDREARQARHRPPAAAAPSTSDDVYTALEAFKQSYRGRGLERSRRRCGTRRYPGSVDPVQVLVDLAGDLARQPGHCLELLAARGQHPLRRAEVVEHRRACAPGRRRAGRRAPSASSPCRAGRGGSSIAKRWASSRTRWSSCSARVSCGSTIGAERPGTKTSSIRLARLTTVTPSSRNSSSSRRPADELALAAVDHDQRRQRGEAGVVVALVRRELALRAVLRHAAAQHLGHRGEVVLRRLADR